MAPPQLAADAPIFEVFHPRKVGLRPARRVERHLSAGHSLGRGALQLVDRNEPLLGQPRLERGVAAVAVHDGVMVIFHVVEQPVLLEPGDDGLAAFIAAHAGELAVAFHHMRRLVEDVDLLKPVALAHGEVVGVVRRRHLHEAGAEARINVEVAEDGNLAVDDGQLHRGADELLLVVVLRRNGHTSVAQHGFGARGGHHDVLLAIDGLGQRVAQVPQMAVLFLVLGLVVGDGGGAVRAPVHDALAAVDQPVMVPVAKHLANCRGVVWIHREVGVGEVDGAAHALDLLDDVPTVLARPIPARLDELLAADLTARDAFARKFFVHLGLGGDAGVVGAKHPASGHAAHAVHADQRVLDGIVERMAHVQHARDVGRRDGYRAIAHAGIAAVVLPFHPLVQHALLDSGGIILFGHVLHGVCFPFKGPCMRARSSNPQRPQRCGAA